MKEVRITQITKERQGYSVYLGNGTINNFTSIKDARHFLTETNKFLNFKIHSLHKIYRDVWLSYQSNWFYFDNGRKVGSDFAKERECHAVLDRIYNHFDLSIRRCDSTNGNYFTFIHLIQASEDLELVVRNIADLYHSREDFNAIYDMDTAIMNLMYLRNEIINYGKTSRTKIFKVPTHLSEDKSYTPELIELRVA